MRNTSLDPHEGQDLRRRDTSAGYSEPTRTAMLAPSGTAPETAHTRHARTMYAREPMDAGRRLCGSPVGRIAPSLDDAIPDPGPRVHIRHGWMRTREVPSMDAIRLVITPSPLRS